jgi:hypothetical protein
VKVCAGCGRELPLTEFVRDARRSDGHGAVCRECMSDRVASGKKVGGRRFDPRPWHRGCRRCGEYERNWYPGRACHHPGSEQGALMLLSARRASFLPESHPEFPAPARCE